MENLNEKAKNTADKTSGKVRLIYVPKQGLIAQDRKGTELAFFRIGGDIRPLLHLPHEYDESDHDPEFPDCTDTYSFFNEKFGFWVSKKDRNILWRMRSDISFVFKGYELIGMKFDDFLSLGLLQPDLIRRDCWHFMFEPREYCRHYTAYYFCKHKLLFHVWRKKIRTVFIGDPFFENKKEYFKKYDIQKFLPEGK